MKEGHHPAATAGAGSVDGRAVEGTGPAETGRLDVAPPIVLGGPSYEPSAEAGPTPAPSPTTVIGRPSDGVLDASPVTVLGGAPSEPDAGPAAAERERANATPAAEESRTTAARTAKQATGRRRVGVAVLTATGVVALAAAPFALVSPTERILGDSASSTTKAKPHNEAGRQAGPQARKQPAVPVPAPTWQPRHHSAAPPARPPAVKLPPSGRPSAGTPHRAPARKPPVRAAERPSPHPRTSPERPVEAARKRPQVSALAVREPTPSATAAEHHASSPESSRRVAKAEPKDAAQPKRSAAATPDHSASASPSPKKAAPHWETKVVHGTYVLNPGDQVRTNRLRLTLQTDGDLVLRDQHGKAVWSSRTHASGTHAVFQADGNFVLYGENDQTLWSSRTDGHDGAVLVLRNDGDLAITQGGTTLWATHTNG